MNKEIIYLAGAHSRAATMGYYLQYLEPSTKILAYIYDNEEPNPKEINGVPVLKITPETKLETDATVYIATRGVNHAHLTETLTKCGMKNIIPVDVNIDLKIRNRFLKKYYEAAGREFLKLEECDFAEGQDKRTAKVYVASSASDKPLQMTYQIASYEKIIQVGASLTDKRLDTDCTDNEGENISDRNTQFCELTGLYWIWKHATDDIVGLGHYRRHFILPDKWGERFIGNGIDVVLPTPLYVSPSLAENYRYRHIESDWTFMMNTLGEIHSDDYEMAKDFFEKNATYSPCNMFIMKKNILDDFCEWLFPVLFACADHIGEREDPYQNRYPGFLSERLMSYYFDSKREKYKIVYCDKDFRQ